MEKLLDGLRNFNPGDLIAGSELLDEMLQLSQGGALSAEEQSLLQDFRIQFKDLLKDSTEEAFRKAIDSFLAIWTERFGDGDPAKKPEAPSRPPQTPPEETDRDKIEIEDAELLVSFIQESKDHLEDIEGKILQLEGDSDKELIDGIFRSIHTVKGISGFIGFSHIRKISHELESLLDDLRSDKLMANEGIINTLLLGSDWLLNRIGQLEAEYNRLGAPAGHFSLSTAPPDYEGLMEAITIIRTSGPETRESPKKETPPKGEKSGKPLIHDLVSPEMIDKFKGESHDLLDSVEEHLLALEKDPESIPSIDSAFRDIHTIKGNAGFIGFPEIERQCMSLESVLDPLRKGEKPANSSIITAMLTQVDNIAKLLDQKAEEAEPGAPADGMPGEPAGEGPKEHFLGEVLVEMGAVSDETIGKALEKQNRKLGEVLVDDGAISKQDLQSALKKQGRPQALDADTSRITAKKSDIRVNTERLDLLFNLMGELITAEAMLINSINEENRNSVQFNQASTYLTKISKEMQEITMAIRMIPLDGLFNKMRRLVRDLSNKFHKKIDFSIRGGETELDRHIIEAISDPLVHIIRNAIDHGIETAEIRRQAGKEEEGMLRLQAHHEGNEIWITVKDDGKGLSRDKILAKARERDLLKRPEDEMSDEDVWNLIFEPGFSTAAQVSDISGRGVGMDVVKRNLEKLRGKIVIASEEGKGTEMSLQIPLTLAIIDGITFRVGDMLFSLPTLDVSEYNKAQPEQVTNTELTQEVVKVRGEHIPVLKLSKYFNIETEIEETAEGILIIVKAYDRKIAILVDEITGYNQLVLKALPEYLRNMRGVTGCSVLGDGGLTLILDPRLMLNEVKN